MSLREIYRAKDGSLFKIKRLSQNPTFFRYEKLSEEEINELADLLRTNDTKRKVKPAPLDIEPESQQQEQAQEPTGDYLQK